MEALPVKLPGAHAACPCLHLGNHAAVLATLQVQRRVAALEAQVRQQAHHLEQARHREVRLQQDMVDTKAAGERATATAEEAKADVRRLAG